jgi:O-succinylbenzoic acid--CoA ligase
VIKDGFSSLSSGTEVLLNPRLPSADAQKLQSLAGQYALTEHVWIASSGSTRSLRDSVKLIALSHKALAASAKAVNLHLESTDRDRWAQVLPRFHVGGLGIEIRAQLSGAKVITALSKTQDQSFKWDSVYFCETCESQKATLGSLVPTQVYDLVHLGLKAPKSFRAIVVGGGALNADLYLKARELGWPLLQSFGMSEACSQVATAGLSTLQRDAMASPPVELKLLSHLEAERGPEGRLKIRGSSLLTGYAQIQSGEYVWMDPKDSEGWLLTEDLVELTPGFLRPLGRHGDYVKILGEGVSLMQLQQKLEAALLKKGFSTASAVIVATAEPRQGSELILVFGSDVPEKAQEDLRTDYNLQVAPYEKVHRVEEVDHIPRSDLGKVKRAELMHKLRFM